jgi:hypothetical protein
MKRTALAALLFFSVVYLNGCLPNALFPLMTAGSVYQGYASISALKNVKGKEPVFKKYRNAFVLVDVQPQRGDSAKMNAAMEGAYSRTISEMAREMGLDLVCRPYETSEVSDEPDALVIQVEEVKSSLLEKLASGGKMNISAKFIDKKTARCLDEENYNVSKSYYDVLGVISFSSLLKMNGDNTTNSGIFKSIMENRKKYPIVTAKERALFSNE